MTMKICLPRAFALAVVSTVASAAVGDFSANYDFTVEHLHKQTVDGYLAKVREAQKQTGYPRPGKSTDPSMLTMQFLDEAWLQTPMLRWASVPNVVRLLVTDYWVTVKFQKVSTDERRARALGMYQCLNIMNQSTIMMQRMGVRVPDEGNRVDDGLKLCGMSTLDNAASTAAP
jgi:hypothetical protein